MPVLASVAFIILAVSQFIIRRHSLHIQKVETCIAKSTTLSDSASFNFKLMDVYTDVFGLYMSHAEYDSAKSTLDKLKELQVANTVLVARLEENQIVCTDLVESN